METAQAPFKVKLQCPQCAAPARIAPKGGSLVYLPFDAMGSELVHGEYCLRVSTQTLEHFRKL